MPSEIKGSSNFDSDSAGKVLQVVSATLTSTASTTSTTFVATGLDATITLSNPANKVMIMATCDTDNMAAYRRIVVDLFVGGTALGVEKHVYDENRAYAAVAVNAINGPASIGPHTYSLRFRSHSGGAVEVNAITGSAAQITLMEIGA